MMGRSGLALLAALPFAVAAAPPACYDRLLKNGDPWTDADGTTCTNVKNDPTKHCTREERTRNEFVSAEACCHCGGGTAPYYVELPSNTCVNDGAHALQAEGLITFLAKTDCCASLPRKEKRECLQTGASAKVFPNYQTGQCSSAAERPPVVFPACAIDATTGATKYIAALFLKKSLPLSDNSFCCMAVYDGLPAAIDRCKAQAGTWYYVEGKGCVRDDGVADDPVTYATAQTLETPSQCRAEYFDQYPAITCTAFTCGPGTADKSGKDGIHCGTQAGDCTEELCCDATCTHNSVKSEKLCVDGFVYRAGVTTVKCADGTVAGCLEVFHEQCCDVTCFALDCGADKERIANADARRCKAGSHLLKDCETSDCCISNTCKKFYTQADMCGDSAGSNPLVSVLSEEAAVSRTLTNLRARKIVMRPGRPGFFFARTDTAVYVVDVTSFAGGDGKVGRSAFTTLVLDSAVFSDGNRVLTAEDDGGVLKVRVWEVVDSVWEFTMLGSVDIPDVYTVALLPGDKHFLTGQNVQDSTTKTIKMWDVSTLAQVGAFTFTGAESEYPLKITALPKHGKYGSGDQAKTYFAVLTSKRKIVTFDTEQATQLRRTTTGHTAYTWDWDVLADGTFVTASNDKTLRITDGLGNQVKTFSAYAPSKANGGTALTPAGIRSVSAAQYGQGFVSGDSDGNVFLWDAAVDTPMRHYKALPNKNAYAIAIAPSGWHPTVAGAHLLIAAANKVTVRPLSKQGCTGACAGADCCAHTCIDFDCSAAVPLTGFRDKADKNAIVCGATAADCNEAKCCDATCGGRETSVCHKNVMGYRLKATPEDIVCGPLDTSCDIATCCHATCTDRNAVCTTGFRLLVPANMDCPNAADSSCDPATCCHATCTDRNAVCTTGFRLLVPANMDCPNAADSSCDPATCCHATCTDRNAVCTTGFRLLVPANMDCPNAADSSCDPATCCHATCTDRNAVCTTGFRLLVPANMDCPNAADSSCDPATCCHATCTDRNAVCTTGFRLLVPANMDCPNAADSSCDPATCCHATCTDRNAVCTTGFRLLVPANMDCPNAADSSCDPATCCHATCTDRNAVCTTGFRLLVPANMDCPNAADSSCDPATCCHATCTDRNAVCTTGFRLLVPANMDCPNAADSSCDPATCCHATCTDRNAVCTTGFRLLVPANMDCPNAADSSCDPATCCHATCTDRNAVCTTGFRLLVPANMDCPNAADSSCDPATCCHATCTDRNAVCTTGFRLLVPANMDCPNAADSSCDPATCCHATCTDRNAVCTTGFRLLVPANMDCPNAADSSCDPATCCHATCTDRNAVCTTGFQLRSPANMDCPNAADTSCDNPTCCVVIVPPP